MPAYVISRVTPKDPQAFEFYRTRAAASIALYGGRYLVRGGFRETLEGDWGMDAVIVVEFADIARAKEWYGSLEYAQALEVRDRALSRDLILVDGYREE